MLERQKFLEKFEGKYKAVDKQGLNNILFDVGDLTKDIFRKLDTQKKDKKKLHNLSAVTVEMRDGKDTTETGETKETVGKLQPILPKIGSVSQLLNEQP